MPLSSVDGDNKDRPDLDRTEPVAIPEPEEIADAGPPDSAPAPENRDPLPPRRPSRLVNFAALFAGGVLAATIGFLVAVLSPGTGWFSGQKTDEIARLDAVLATEGDNIATLGATLDSQSAALDGLQADIADVKNQISTLADQQSQMVAQGTALDQLASRISDLENRPIPDIGPTQDAVATYERELAAMRAMFSQELSRIETAQKQAEAQLSDAADTGRGAAITAAMSKLSLAVRSGAALGPALQELSAQDVEIPPELVSHSDGVTSLAALQQTFPDAARQAIDADIRKRAEAGEIGRIGAFLRLQLGQRSLTPRVGDDADAVLSRAEAALGGGDVAAALAGVRSLPDLGAPLLKDWIAAATDYQTVGHSIDALTATLNEQG